MAGAGLLIYAAWRDLLLRMIPNEVSLALLLCGFLSKVPLGGAALSFGVVTASGLFALTMLLWSRSVIGGADAKLIPAASLVLPTTIDSQVGYIIGVALAGGCLSVLYLMGMVATRRFLTRRCHRRMAHPAGPPRRWHLIRRWWRLECRRLLRRPALPYVVAILGGYFVAMIQ